MSSPQSLSAPQQTNRLRRPFAVAALWLCVWPVAGGCYDGQELVELAQAEAMRTRLDEVDLGRFHTSLPRNPNGNSVTEIEFEIFASAARYRVPTIEERLERERFRLRSETLRAVRQASPEELTEPDLASLKGRIASVANEILEDNLIQAVGFKSFRLMYQ